MKISYSKRLFGWVLLITLPLLVAAVLSSFLVSSDATRRTNATISGLLDSHRSYINNQLGLYEQAAMSLASDPLLQSHMEQFNLFRLRKLNSRLIPSGIAGIPAVDLTQPAPFKRIIESLYARKASVQANIDGIQLLGPNGTSLGETEGFSGSPADPSLVFRGMKQQGVTAGPAYSSADQRWSLPYVAPIRSTRGRVLGALVIDYPLAPALAFVNHHSSGANTMGAYVVHKSDGQTPEILSLSTAGIDLGNAAADSITADSVQTRTENGSNNNSSLVSYANLDAPSLGLVIRSKNNAHSPLSNKLLSFTVIALLTTLALLGAGWYLIIRPFNARLARIADATGKLAVRDYQVKINDKALDHAGSIARHVDQIAAEFNEGFSVRLAVEERMQQAADRDDLTGLYNQDYFTQALNRLESNPAALPATIACIKLRGYQQVKETHGDSPAAEILVAVGKRMRAAMDHQHTIARRRGSEFLVLATSTNADAARELQRNIDNVFTTSFETSVGELLIGCRSGIDTATSTQELNQCLSNAENGIKQTANTGESVSAGTKECTKALESALKQGRVDVWYQPVVRLVEGSAPTMVAAEAFVRVYDDAGELIPPNTFMPHIQDSPMGLVIDRFMLRKSAEKVNQWVNEDLVPEEFSLSINLSRQSAQNNEIVSHIQDLLATLSLAPKYLTLEVSGGAQLINTDVLARLRELGITLALDDVGLQYSNLEQLINIKPSIAKIDHRRLQSEDENTDRDIQLQLNTIWQTLGMVIVAKSVETGEQIAELAGRGVTLFQGYLFDHPRDGDSFIKAWGCKQSKAEHIQTEDLRKAS